MQKIQTTGMAWQFMKEAVPEGGTVIDATMGRGNDTVYLCELVGAQGKVLAFDVQQEAVESTRQRLGEAGYMERVRLIQDSHEYMEHYVQSGTVDGIMFNFGYLPRADHKISTRADTSLRAIEAGLRLLKRGGVISLCIYQGKDTGFEEKEKILEYLKQLSYKQYTVAVCELYNRPNNPPIFAGIVKDSER